MAANSTAQASQLTPLNFAPLETKPALGELRLPGSEMDRIAQDLLNTVILPSANSVVSPEQPNQPNIADQLSNAVKQPANATIPVIPAPLPNLKLDLDKASKEFDAAEEEVGLPEDIAKESTPAVREFLLKQLKEANLVKKQKKQIEQKLIDERKAVLQNVLGAYLPKVAPYIEREKKNLASVIENVGTLAALSADNPRDDVTSSVFDVLAAANSLTQDYEAIRAADGKTIEEKYQETLALQKKLAEKEAEIERLRTDVERKRQPIYGNSSAINYPTEQTIVPAANSQPSPPKTISSIMETLSPSAQTLFKARLVSDSKTAYKNQIDVYALAQQAQEQADLFEKGRLPSLGNSTYEDVYGGTVVERIRNAKKLKTG